MTFSKDSFIRLIYTIIVSSIINVASSIVFFSSEISSSSLLISIAVGSTIWFLSEWGMSFVSNKWPHKIFPSYVALFLLIAIGTSLGTLVLGIDSLAIILLICFCAEVFGISIAVFYHNYYKKLLNKHLEQFKESN